MREFLTAATRCAVFSREVRRVWLKRDLYATEHDAYRETVREFVQREVAGNSRAGISSGRLSRSAT